MFKKFIDKLTGKDKKKENLTKAEENNEVNEDKKNDEQDEQIEDYFNKEEAFQEAIEENVDDETKLEEVEKTEETEEINMIQEEAQEEIDIFELEDIESEIEEKIELEEVQEEVEEESGEVEEVEEEIEEIEEIEEVKETKSKFNLFKRLKEGLSKTKSGITDRVDNLLKSYKKIDEDLFEELEEILITSDMGVQTTMEIVDGLRDRVRKEKVSDPIQVKELLIEKLTEILEDLPGSEIKIEPSPAIILVVGVNGVGKTTSIGKMAHRFKSEGKKVLLAAGDTFRAAAIDQLKIWGDRVGVDVIRHQEEADPAAVIYDAIQAAKARNIDVLICDTAGRLHNKKNLMNELGKIFKVVDREYDGASKEILLVLDATTGQNAVQQAKTFKEVAQITGLVLTKLDGTAKGGVVVGISRELNVPVKLIGVGEKMEDLQEFNPQTFVKAIFGEEE